MPRSCRESFANSTRVLFKRLPRQASVANDETHLELVLPSWPADEMAMSLKAFAAPRATTPLSGKSLRAVVALDSADMHCAAIFSL